MSVSPVRVSSAFYFDHTEARDLEAPPILRENKSHVWIDPTHPACHELLSDADFYATCTGFDFGNQRQIINGARQTLRALEKAGVK